MIIIEDAEAYDGKKNLETDTHFYFWTNWLSNWKICKIVDPITKLEYDSTEQIYMWYKASFFNDAETRKQLEVKLTPKQAKDLGRVVKNYQDDLWECVRYGYMVYVNYLKYTQNAELKAKLLSTGNKVLAEASPYDKVWGVGFMAGDPLILNEANWTGRNLLGKSLMEVRNLLNK